MGGAYVMVYEWDIASTAVEDLRDCGRLVQFMESTDFTQMAPRDDLAFDGTQYTLADPPNSYILYASALAGQIGVRGIQSGQYDFRWYDIPTGTVVEQTGVAVTGGDVSWPSPQGVGAELAVSIQVAAPPTASLAAGPLSGDAPLTVSFDGSASTDADGSIASHAWDFGDGQAASGTTASHLYSVPGSYAVTLTVTDDGGGTATATASIQVAAPPPPNQPPTASLAVGPLSGDAPLTVSFDGSA